MSTLLSTARLIQFADSMLPVGAFSFSNGLESAIQQGVVHNLETLGQFVRGIVAQAATVDGVALLHAFRAASRPDLDRLAQVDQALLARKLSEEPRQMSLRMGRKLVELAHRVLEAPLAGEWLERVASGQTPGTYPACQGLVFATLGLTEQAAFCAHQYGLASQMLGASLRLMRVSHLDVQALLYAISSDSDAAYQTAAPIELGEMRAYHPMLDILSAIHVRSNVRLFMS